jgi:GPH family glycoside/pentoside/hexuronide:cation symporter
MILAMISDALDHIEAKRGFRCDGFTMSVYSSIMVAATGVCTAIFNGISGAGSNLTAISISYVWGETVAYAVCGVLIAFFTVEKYLSDDQKKIVERQKEEVLAAGGEWIDPEERLRREQEEADKLAEDARKAELKARCEKRGLSFEEEEKKYLEKLAAKKKQ